MRNGFNSKVLEILNDNSWFEGTYELLLDNVDVCKLHKLNRVHKILTWRPWLWI